MSLKNYRHSLSLFQVFTSVLLGQIITSSPCFAGYDLSDPYTRPDPSTQVSLSGGQGTGLGGVAGQYNTNVSFDQFSTYNGGSFTPNPNSQMGSPAPFDELPIDRQQQAANGQNIYYTAPPTNTYQFSGGTGSLQITQSGTGTQKPTQGYAQTSNMLLSGPASEIPHDNKLTYGFPKGVTTIYTGLNYSNGSNPQYGGVLPPTSLGSVDLNIINNTRKIPEADISTPATMP